MKKIMFNDRYGLTQAVIEGRKTMTRRIIIPQPDFLSDNFGWAKRNNGDVILPKYGVGEVVAVAQSYEQAGIQSWAYLSRPEIDGYQIISTHKGWRNKMYVSADLMPHQIRITGAVAGYFGRGVFTGRDQAIYAELSKKFPHTSNPLCNRRHFKRHSPRSLRLAD